MNEMMIMISNLTSTIPLQYYNYRGVIIMMIMMIILMRWWIMVLY